MVKDVIISVKGLQMAPDNENDIVEMIYPGEYYFRNGKHYLIYDEVTEGFTQSTKNIIKVTNDYMELTKKGVVNVHMLFEKRQKNNTYYYTPYGSLQIGIDATSVDVFETEERIHIDASYALEINCEHVADCNITIDVKPKGSHIQLNNTIQA